MLVEIQTVDANSGFGLCVYPSESRRKRAAWILWIAEDGSGHLYTERDEDGAVKGEPMILPASVSRAARKRNA